MMLLGTLTLYGLAFAAGYFCPRFCREAIKMALALEQEINNCQVNDAWFPSHSPLRRRLGVCRREKILKQRKLSCRPLRRRGQTRDARTAQSSGPWSPSTQRYCSFAPLNSIVSVVRQAGRKISRRGGCAFQWQVRGPPTSLRGIC
jgi:hypothetical protein